MKWYFKRLNLFRFKGRLSRKSYWLFANFSGIIFLFLRFFVLPTSISYSGPNLLNLVLAIIILLFAIVFAALNISFSVRRLHDINRSGWWFLLFKFIPFLEMNLMLRPSSKGVNRYGSPHGSDENNFSDGAEINPNINQQIADQISAQANNGFHKEKSTLNKSLLKENLKIEIFCPKCTVKCKVDSNLMGSNTECEGCGYKFVINSDLIYNNDSTKFSIKCPMCDYKYELDSSLKGRKVSCAICDAVFIA